MIRAQSPEEKTVQFKGKMEKEVEFRLDQSLVYVKLPSSHLLLFEERGHPFLQRRVRCSTASGRFSVELLTLRKLMDIFEFLVCLQLPQTLLQGADYSQNDGNHTLPS